jgi:integrase
MKVPNPVIVGDIRAQVMPARGQDRAGRWYWRARRGGDQAYVWTGRGEAHEVLQALAAIATGHAPAKRDTDGPAMDSVGQALDVWWTTAVDPDPDRAEASKATYRVHVRALSRTIGHVALDQATARHAEAHRMARHKAGTAPRTIHAELATLAQAWKWWRDIGRTTVEVPKITVKISDRRPRRTPTPGELATVRQAAPGWISDALGLQGAWGARIGEVLHLQPQDVDLEAGLVHLGRHEGATKTGPRTLPLRGEARDILERVLAAPVKRTPTRFDAWPGPELFGCPKTSWSTIQRWLRAFDWKAHRIEPFTSHGIRRMVTDALVRARVDLSAAAAVLGHSPVMMLRVYRQVTDADKALAMQQAGLGLEPGENNVVPLVRHKSQAQKGD